MFTIDVRHSCKNVNLNTEDREREIQKKTIGKLHTIIIRDIIIIIVIFIIISRVIGNSIVKFTKV